MGGIDGGAALNRLSLIPDPESLIPIPHPESLNPNPDPVPIRIPSSESRVPSETVRPPLAPSAQPVLNVPGMAKTLEEFPVYLKAREFNVAVAAIIARPAFGRNRKLHDQLADANESILANMEEGFEQSTDAVLANYLYTAKGSIAEVVVQVQGRRTSRLAHARRVFAMRRARRRDSAYARRLDQVS